MEGVLNLGGGKIRGSIPFDNVGMSEDIAEAIMP